MMQNDEVKSHKVLMPPTLNYEDYDLIEDETKDDITQLPSVDKSIKKRVSSSAST